MDLDYFHTILSLARGQCSEYEAMVYLAGKAQIRQGSTRRWEKEIGKLLMDLHEAKRAQDPRALDPGWICHQSIEEMQPLMGKMVEIRAERTYRGVLKTKAGSSGITVGCLYFGSVTYPMRLAEDFRQDTVHQQVNAIAAADCQEIKVERQQFIEGYHVLVDDICRNYGLGSPRVNHTSWESITESERLFSTSIF